MSKLTPFVLLEFIALLASIFVVVIVGLLTVRRNHMEVGGMNKKHSLSPMVSSRFLFCRASVACFLVVLLMEFSTEAMAMGEKYSEQGGRLSSAIKDMLIAKGFCKSPGECHALLPSYGGHGDRVRSAFYEVGNKNNQAFHTIIEFVVKDGIRITDGVPITITGYRESHDEYRNSGVFSKDVKPFLILEVNK